MIRVYLAYDDNANTIMITGHGRADVCAGVSAIFQTFALGLAATAAAYPKELSVSIADGRKAKHNAIHVSLQDESSPRKPAPKRKR